MFHIWINLYLDIVLLPTGELIVKDADELEEAFSNGLIDKSLYDLAWEELNCLKTLINNNKFELIKLSNQHKNILIDRLN
jgi:uncharacterized protein